ncbi:MAG: AsmA family protein, partial [Planctomycetes bacterium]|nr:AsmA family protein [Planctomycetota bacterium]
MRQTTRWVLLGILAVTLLSAGALLLSNQLGWEAQRRIIERRASAALGLEVSIEGDLELTLLPALEFQASQVSVGNLPGRPSPYLARVGRLDLQLSLLALLRRELAIEALELEEVDLRIENDPNGHVEVAEKAANPAHTAEERHLLFRIGRLTVRDLRVTYQPGD